jgi:hypothetical protein
MKTKVDLQRNKEQVMVVVLRRAGDGNYFFEDGKFDDNGEFKPSHIQSAATPMLTIANLTARVIQGITNQ